MKPAPAPLPPSGLSENCPDIIGQQLLLRCCNGWGWTHQPNGTQEIFEDSTLFSGDIEIIPEQYVDFTAPRSGFYGHINKLPGDYSFTKFVAFIMTEGCDFDLTDNIAPAWRVFLGDGDLDLDSSWMPILTGEKIGGYGTIAENSKAHDKYETKIKKENKIE